MVSLSTEVHTHVTEFPASLSNKVTVAGQRRICTGFLVRPDSDSVACSCASTANHSYFRQEAHDDGILEAHEAHPPPPVAVRDWLPLPITAIA